MRLILVVAGLAALAFADREREEDGAFASRLGRHHTDDHIDHQAILGSKKVAEEFDELPPQEAKRRLRILAVKMDTNKDGIIDKDELTAWVEHSMRSLDEEEVEERMKEMDTNGDGKVSWQEYLVDSFAESDLSKLDADDKKSLEEDEKYFKAADVNNDGHLDREELSAFINPENFKHMHETLVEITLWEKDTNRDGAIDVNEYLGDMAENTQSQWHSVEKNRFMAEYDHDGDELLKGDEIRQWLIPDVKAVANQEATHLITGADTNGDGKLTIDEVVAAHKLFVGSEVTNYGDALHRLHTEL